jgi:DNA primase
VTRPLRARHRLERSRTLVERIRGRLDVPTLLAGYGVRLVRGRCACPLCGATNVTTFSVSSDGQHWRCFRCDRRGDVIDLVAELEGISLGGAIRRCAELAGEHETAAERAERRLRQGEREQRDVELRAHHHEFRERWREQIHESGQARAEQVAVRRLVQTDPDEQDPRTRRALDAIGDPYLAEQLAHYRLDELEAEWRAWRVEHGDPSVPVARAIEAMWFRWRTENSVDRALRGGPDVD